MAQVNVTRDDTYKFLGELYVEKEALRRYAEKLEEIVASQQQDVVRLEGELEKANETPTPEQ